jgi:hypothetical protein|nr:MAG TPA: hypothetical protein [Caudoviricetes sp.]
MRDFLVSIVLGMLPEILYFTFFIIYTKNIKEKRFKLLGLIALIYFLIIFLVPYKIIFYTIFIFLLYGILKLLYKERADKIDIFVIAFATGYLSVVSYFCFNFFNKDLSNYNMLYVVNRILLFLPFIFRKDFNKIYLKYRMFWNRDDGKDINKNIKKRPRAISLRNMSLIAINSIIIFMNYYFILMFEFIEGR